MESGDFTVRFAGRLESQGGGHGRISSCEVVFPCISKPLDHQESRAYEFLQALPLAAAIPRFFGVHSGNIVISDATAGFSSPCVMDVKVGTRHYDMYATPEKAQYLINKQRGSTADSHGVRLIDAKVRRGGAVAAAWDKKQGLKFSIDELQHTLREFVPETLGEQLRARLCAIRDMFAATVQQCHGFRMYAASVLVTYDGDAPERGVRCSLIDFAHTFRNIEDEQGNPRTTDKAYDDGVLFGFESLINLI